jgi:hypothetical protein
VPFGRHKQHLLQADADYWGSAACIDVVCVTQQTEHSGEHTTPAGLDCTFPFDFMGETYYSCAKNQFGESDEEGWCP